MAFNAAADIGDSVGAFGKGVYGAGKGFVTGTVGLAVGAAKVHNELVIGTAEYAVTGNPNRLHELASEVKSGAQAAWQEAKTTAAIAKAGYSNPMAALDAATELGIKGTSEIVGGATFDTALLVAPMAKGAPVAAIVQESRRGINLLAPKAVATTETAAGKAAAARAAERAAARTAAAEEAATKGPLASDGFIVAKHGDMPTPRPTATESHHGAMSRWMEEHFSGYKPDKAPAVLMPGVAHDATRGIYNTWRAETRRQLGGKFDWAKVPESDIRALGEKMFSASKTPQMIQEGYWSWFDRMKTALSQPKASGQ